MSVKINLKRLKKKHSQDLLVADEPEKICNFVVKISESGSPGWLCIGLSNSQTNSHPEHWKKKKKKKR